MTPKGLLLWCPRVLGFAVTAFMGLFALDALESGGPRAWADAAIHLVPAAVVLTVVVLSWRRPWIGGVTFVLLGVAYALAVSVRLDWIAAISGPLMVLGALYLLAWRRLRVNAD
jgi:hypothetical protein